MTPSEAKAALAQLCAQAHVLSETAKTAQRNNKSLRGDNFYGHRFHDAVAALTGTLSRLNPALTGLTEAGTVAAVDALKRSCETLKSFDADNQTRMKAVKSIELACHGTLAHAIDALDAAAVPATEQVLPMAVVNGTRGYFEKIVQFANGCYERGWFDPASVMIRRFVETLVIEVYEFTKRAADIKDKDDNFFMLEKLIEIISADKAFNLARETKATLPLVKQLGDRSAHNRRYLAKKADVDKVVPGLRVVADDLLHLAGLK
jgi:hypothetical protein